MVERLRKKGVAVPVSSSRMELARIQNLTRSGDLDRAGKALDQLAPKAVELASSIALERAEIAKRRRDRAGEIAILEPLAYDPGQDPAVGAEALDRLGRSAMAIDDVDRAVKAFDALAERYPKHQKAAEAQFLASWLPYNKGEYALATKRFLDFADRYKKWRRRPEALWFAGWSAFLGKDFALSRRALEQLLEEHPGSDMALWAHYWIGRMREQEQDLAGAATGYRNVLRIAPLSYQAGWASARLEKLGERVVMTPPPGEAPATLEQVLKMLGAERPASIDRGIALHRGGIEGEALEEVEEAYGELERIKDTRGRVMVAEMLASLGAPYHAFRMATRITAGGADLITGEPYAWRAWRMAYPKAFWNEVQRAAEAHDVDPLLILSIMRTESHFRPAVRSVAGARGLMQLMPATAKRIGQVADGGRVHAARYTDPASNIWLGAWYLRRLLDRYDGQIALAAGAYNAGPGAMDRWVRLGTNMELDAFIESVSYRETRMYMRRVLETYQVYRRLDAAPTVDLAWVVHEDLPKKSEVSF
jgi:soluble lytic murein transglycosylase